MSISAISYKSLQVHVTLLCDQHHKLKRLVPNIDRKGGVVGRLSEVHHGVIYDVSHKLSDSGNYAVSFFDVRCFIKYLGLVVKNRLAAMYRGNCDTMLQLSVVTILVLVDDIGTVVVEQN